MSPAASSRQPAPLLGSSAHGTGSSAHGAVVFFSVPCPCEDGSVNASASNGGGGPNGETGPQEPPPTNQASPAEPSPSASAGNVGDAAPATGTLAMQPVPCSGYNGGGGAPATETTPPMYDQYNQHQASLHNYQLVSSANGWVGAPINSNGGWQGAPSNSNGGWPGAPIDSNAPCEENRLRPNYSNEHPAGTLPTRRNTKRNNERFLVVLTSSALVVGLLALVGLGLVLWLVLTKRGSTRVSRGGGGSNPGGLVGGSVASSAMMRPGRSPNGPAMFRTPRLFTFKHHFEDLFTVKNSSRIRRQRKLIPNVSRISCVDDAPSDGPLLFARLSTGFSDISCQRVSRIYSHGGVLILPGRGFGRRGGRRHTVRRHTSRRGRVLFGFGGYACFLPKTSCAHPHILFFHVCPYSSQVASLTYYLLQYLRSVSHVCTVCSASVV